MRNVQIIGLPAPLPEITPEQALDVVQELRKHLVAGATIKAIKCEDAKVFRPTGVPLIPESVSAGLTIEYPSVAKPVAPSCYGTREVLNVVACGENDCDTCPLQSSCEEQAPKPPPARPLSPPTHD